jgi:transposase-like protein
VPLSTKLMHVLITRSCPHCGRQREKLGVWFLAIRHYECEGCGADVQMGYSEKVALFEAHGGVTRKPK